MTIGLLAKEHMIARINEENAIKQQHQEKVDAAISRAVTNFASYMSEVKSIISEQMMVKSNLSIYFPNHYLAEVKSLDPDQATYGDPENTNSPYYAAFEDLRQWGKSEDLTIEYYIETGPVYLAKVKISPDIL